MKKLMLALALAGLSSVATAETFSVDVDVNAMNTPLSYRQTISMAFPSIEVHDATLIGAQCASGNNTVGYNNMNADMINSLCPHMFGNGAEVEIMGAPNATISYTVSAPSQLAAGLRFDVNNNGNAIVTNIDSGGMLLVPVEGVLTLVNKAEVNSGSHSYSYDFVAAYQ